MHHKIVSTAVISYGISSKTFHIPFITTHGGFSLDMILERSGETCKEKFPTVKVAKSIEEVLNDPSIELVVITSPNTTHFPYAKAALEAGKHVVVEKPFTNTSAEALELIELSNKTGKICSVFHNRRYVADFLTMKKILDDGLLGAPREFFAHYDRFRPDPRTYGLWREHELPGSGVFYDLGPHLIDQALVLFGKPTYITADIRKMKSYSKVDDFFDVKLEYDNLMVTLHSSMLVREMGPRYMIHGTKGSFIKHGEDPQEDLLKAGVVPTGPDWGKEEEQFFGLMHTEMRGKIVREMYPSLQGSFGYYYDNLYKTIAEKQPLRETAIDGYNVIRLIELAFESSSERRTIKVSGLL
ncbi:oxidoreductase [Bacteroidota bacterium]|nr:oxidoreductase [Bacteroidota bacterium]